MIRTYALLNPIQYTPGAATVMIPVQSVAPRLEILEVVHVTQDELAPDGGNWGDEEIRAAARAGLEADYAGDTIEVLTADEWAARNPSLESPEPPPP